jgi:hypothetical protein
MLESFHYAVFRKVLTVASASATLVLTYSLLFLARRLNIALFEVLAGLTFVAGMFFSFLTIREMIIRMEEDQAISLRMAFLQTVYGYALKLAFVPLVGPMIEKYGLGVKPHDPWHQRNED